MTTLYLKLSVKLSRSSFLSYQHWKTLWTFSYQYVLFWPISWFELMLVFLHKSQQIFCNVLVLSIMFLMSKHCPCVFIFGQNSGIEKAFLFDVVSKIYIATDSSPVDMQSYELCCDMIDVVIDVSCIYGWEKIICQGSPTGRPNLSCRWFYLASQVL